MGKYLFNKKKDERLKSIADNVVSLRSREEREEHMKSLPSSTVIELRQYIAWSGSFKELRGLKALYSDLLENKQERYGNI